MKKISLFLLLLVLVGAAFPISTTSAAIKDDGETWWSVSEMIDFARQVEIEKENLCHGDRQCAEEYIYSKMEEDEKYRALENFLQPQIWLTAINPQAETIKILFFDDDMMLKRMGIHEKVSLTELYFGWFDDWRGQIYNYDHDRFANGEVEGGLHNMYNGNSVTNGTNWLPAWQEVELSVAGSDLVQNTSGKIDYAAYADNYNAQGYFDFSSCLNAADYQVGLECKLMFSANRWVSYFPPRTEIEPEQPDNNVTQNPTNPASQHGSDDSAVSDQNNPGDQSTPDQDNSNDIPATGQTATNPNDNGDNQNNTLEYFAKIDSPTLVGKDEEPEISRMSSVQGRYIDTPGFWSGMPTITYGYPRVFATTVSQATPASSLERKEKSNASYEDVRQASTGSVSSWGDDVNLPMAGQLTNDCKNNVIFPWWLIILLIVGDALLLWLFWPRRREERQ